MTGPQSSTFTANVFEEEEFDDFGVLARIVPLNEAAKAAFDGLARGQERGSLQEYHNQFIQVEGFAKREEVVYSSDSEADVNSPLSPRSDQSSALEAEQLEGHYVLSLLRPPLLASGVGWRIGKGMSRSLDRSVDILVISPGRPRGHDSADARMRSSLATVHAHIQLHRKSGVLILSAGDSRKPVDIFDEDTGEWKAMVHPESSVLHRPFNRFRLGLLEFAVAYPRVQHDRENEQYTQLSQRRNEYMRANLGVRPPHPQIPVVPPQDVHIRDGLRIFRTVGAGGFGCVSAAIDVKTGDPYAVKETVIKHRDQIEEIRAEFDIGQSIEEGAEGLVRSTRMFCEHGHSGPCDQRPEVVWIVSDLARMDFGKFPFHKLPRKNRINLLKQLIAGLATLHESGIMHRDISERNCLILSADPAQAAICDFGKATRALHCTEAALGPKYTLAPEIDGKTRYNNSIDVWALGLVFFRILFPGQPVTRLTPSTHEEAMKQLERGKRRSPSDVNVFELIGDMLSWDSFARPTALQALARIRGLEQPELVIPAVPTLTEEPAPKKQKKDEESVPVPPQAPVLHPANESQSMSTTQPFTHEIIPRLYPAED